MNEKQKIIMGAAAVIFSTSKGYDKIKESVDEAERLYDEVMSKVKDENNVVECIKVLAPNGKEAYVTLKSFEKMPHKLRDSLYVERTCGAFMNVGDNGYSGIQLTGQAMPTPNLIFPNVMETQDQLERHLQRNLLATKRPDIVSI